MSTNSWQSGFFLVLVVAALTGCSGSKPTPVHGKVTLSDGTPVVGATVVFDDPEKHIRSSGMTQSDGSYSLRTPQAGDGAEVGRYKVTVHQPLAADSRQPPQPSVFHPRYESSAKSGLEYTVKKGDNVYDVKLDKP